MTRPGICWFKDCTAQCLPDGSEGGKSQSKETKGSCGKGAGGTDGQEWRESGLREGGAVLIVLCMPFILPNFILKKVGRGT